MKAKKRDYQRQFLILTPNLLNKSKKMTSANKKNLRLMRYVFKHVQTSPNKTEGVRKKKREKKKEREIEIERMKQFSFNNCFFG